MSIVSLLDKIESNNAKAGAPIVIDGVSLLLVGLGVWLNLHFSRLAKA